MRDDPLMQPDGGTGEFERVADWQIRAQVQLMFCK